ncbi:MAG: flagellar biosynthesis protein FlhB [Planctomycetota bacterium]
MADESSGEKTEQPTAKKLSEAREKGNVAMSKEVLGATVFIIGISTIKITGGELFDTIADLMRTMFSLPVDRLYDLSGPTQLLQGLGGEIGSILMPIMIALFVAVGLAGFLQVGIGFSLKPLSPDATKLDPVKGVKKLFGLDNMMLTGMSLVKMTLVGIVAVYVVVNSLETVAGLADKDIETSGLVLAALLFNLVFKIAAGLTLIALIDLFYRRWKHNKDLMMSKQEVKDEGKMAEGDPLVKAKIRENQRKMAMRRMKGDVQEADVVVRNPTHFAVALKYDGDAHAPRVVAKGRALMALRIIEIAEEAGVTIVENRPLARNLYRSVRVGDWIPERLFMAVAEVLSYVYRKRGRKMNPAEG